MNTPNDWDSQDFDADSSGRSQKHGKKSDDGWHWLLIVLGFIVWWPVGLVLMFLQLFGKLAWKCKDKPGISPGRLSGPERSPAGLGADEAVLRCRVPGRI